MAIFADIRSRQASAGDRLIRLKGQRKAEPADAREAAVASGSEAESHRRPRDPCRFGVMRCLVSMDAQRLITLLIQLDGAGSLGLGKPLTTLPSASPNPIRRDRTEHPLVNSSPARRHPRQEEQFFLDVGSEQRQIQDLRHPRLGHVAQIEPVQSGRQLRRCGASVRAGSPQP